MVKSESSQLDRTFSALGDPTRRAIISRLARGEATVTELSEPFDMSLPAISRHLRVLEDAGLIARRREGRLHHIMLKTAALLQAVEWLTLYENFWKDSFDALGDLIEKDQA